MDGRIITCEIIVSFAWFFTDSPKTLPILNDTAIKIASFVLCYIDNPALLIIFSAASDAEKSVMSISG